MQGEAMPARNEKTSRWPLGRQHWQGDYPEQGRGSPGAAGLILRQQSVQM
jgi:hypothetical protein